MKATIKGRILTEIVRILGKRTEVNRRPRCLPRVGRTKGTTGFPKPEIGIETIRCKQGIVTVPILHTLEILKFEGDKARVKHLRHLS